MESLYNPITKVDSSIQHTQKVALSFFPINLEHIQIKVFRKLSLPGDKKTDNSECSLRQLPVIHKSDHDQEEYKIYWVSYHSRDGFEEFICDPHDNIYLTKDLLFEALVKKSNDALDQARDFSLREGFRNRTIYFNIRCVQEGCQTLWLEPYFLRSAKKYGFLADFRFLAQPGSKATRRIQQLSLSLDKDGRSNKNYYLDRFEQLKEFLQKYYSKIFPILIGDSEVYMEKTLLTMDAKLLKPKSYIFANAKANTSQYMGIKSAGPFESPKDEPKIYFLYRKQEKPFADELFKALRGDTYTNTFSGMEKMFHFSLGRENVGGRAIDGYDIESLKETIDSIQEDADGRKVIPLLIIPYKRDGSPESTHLYYLAKYIFMKEKLASQFVSIVQLKSRDQLKWSVSNIALGLYAKMGGKPWIVSPEAEKSLIIGVGQAHKISNDVVKKYYAYSVLTESTGLYKELKILGQGPHKDEYIKLFKDNLKTIFNKYCNEYKTFVIHTTFSIPKDELNAIKQSIDEIRETNGSANKFVVMKFNDQNKYFGYSLDANSLIPFESSYIRLSKDEFLVWFEGLQFHNPRVQKKIERPLHIQFIYPPAGLSDQEMTEHLQEAINLSGANWRGFNAKSLPVSIYYAYLIADHYKELQGLGLDEIDIENINPWFL